MRSTVGLLRRRSERSSNICARFAFCASLTFFFLPSERARLVELLLELLGVALELADLVDDLADAIDVELLVELGLVLVDVLDDILDADLALAQALADLEELLDGDRAVEHGLEHLALAVLDALRDLDLALAGEQRDRAHLAQVHADGVARTRVRVLLVLVDFLLLFLVADQAAASFGA